MKIVTPRDDQEISKLFKTDSNIILDFYANWCGPCKSVSTAFSEIAKEEMFKNLTVIKINIEKFSHLSNVYNIKSLPTIIFTTDHAGERKNIKTKVGSVNKNDLITLIDDAYEQ
tara:strand:- start:689 stop:1030 length:342 start_codon:yes stop_codon:yes gene_type:complete